MQEGNIWVSTFGGGLDRFRDEKFVTYSSKVGLSYDNVNTVMGDRTGTMVIGTTYGGVNLIKDGKVTVIDTRKGLPSMRSARLRRTARAASGSVRDGGW